jgi:hypothetical protein
MNLHRHGARTVSGAEGPKNHARCPTRITISGRRRSEATPRWSLCGDACRLTYPRKRTHRRRVDRLEVRRGGPKVILGGRLERLPIGLIVALGGGLHRRVPLTPMRGLIGLLIRLAAGASR